MAGRESQFPDADRRDLAAVERAARDLVTQIEYLRSNGPTDAVRWRLIAGKAFDAWRVAAKADRRHAKRNGRRVYRWYIPRGYGWRS